MGELPRALAAFLLPVAAMTPIVLMVVFRHQREMALIKQQANPNPQLAADVQELKKQVADMRELMIDIALQPSSAALQQRVKQDSLQ
jgi:hypothetical protein